MWQIPRVLLTCRQQKVTLNKKKCQIFFSAVLSPTIITHNSTLTKWDINVIEFPGFWGEKFVGLDGHRPFFCILMSDPEKERFSSSTSLSISFVFCCMYLEKWSAKNWRTQKNLVIAASLSIIHVLFFETDTRLLVGFQDARASSNGGPGSDSLLCHSRCLVQKIAWC